MGIQKPLRITIAILLFLGLVINTTMTANAQVEKVPRAGIAINGKVVTGIDPIKIDGTYYLPFEQLAKILGYHNIKFNKNTLTYEVTDGSTKVRVTMGGTKAKKGNELVNIKPPQWINDTAYVSLHAGGALFNSYIKFMEKNGSIQVQRPARKYIVHTGDTLWTISRIHHTTVNALKKANNLSSTILKDGQALKIPNSGSPKEMEPIKEHEPVKINNNASVATNKQNVIEEAKKYIGAGYKFGATPAEAPNLFDCSSYTQLVLNNVGINIPRVSRDQASKGKAVTQLQAGDLMFFTMKDIYSDGRVAHVGIYMGDGNMIHASSSKGVAITKNVLQNSYWSKNYLFSKRIIK